MFQESDANINHSVALIKVVPEEDSSAELHVSGGSR